MIGEGKLDGWEKDFQEGNQDSEGVQKRNSIREVQRLGGVKPRTSRREVEKLSKSRTSRWEVERLGGVNKEEQRDGREWAEGS